VKYAQIQLLHGLFDLYRVKNEAQIQLLGPTYVHCHFELYRLKNEICSNSTIDIVFLSYFMYKMKYAQITIHYPFELSF
jgi:tRNA A37 threonylcarbamoyladenosine biosynthesis protein TsaE